MTDMRKTIWMLWFQGWRDAPDIAKACLKSWGYHNPEWEIKALDRTSIYNYLDPKTRSHLERLAPMRPAAESDIIRISLLNNHGGVWVDSTVMCTQPLNSWLLPKMNQGFWGFKKKYSGWRILYLVFSRKQGSCVSSRMARIVLRILERW